MSIRQRWAMRTGCGALLAASVSCSLGLTSGPPPNATHLTQFYCTETYVVPALDFVYGAGMLGVGFLAIPQIAAGVVGVRRVKSCRAARAQWQRSVDALIATPEGLRDDVTLESTPISVSDAASGDTMHVGGTAQAHAIALNRGGAEVKGRKFLWTTSDASVVTVDEFGGLSAKAAGGATIIARTGGASGAKRMIVVP